MTHPHEADPFWSIFSTTTDTRVTAGFWFDQQQAEKQIETWQWLQARGELLDIDASDLEARPLPFL